MSDSRGSAAAMRLAFDAAFALPARLDMVPVEDLLAIRVGGDAYALRLTELAGLMAARPVVPVPSPAPEFLGIAGFRGGILPVYSLRGLLGYPPGEACRWLARAAGGAVGLAFEELEGFLRVPRADFAAPDRPRGHVHQAVHTAGVLRPVLDLSSLVEAIKRAADQAGTKPRSDT